MNRTEFCKKLKKARIDAQITQETAAKTLNTAISAISAIENGTRKIDALELEALAKLYKKEIGCFFDSQESISQKNEEDEITTEAAELMKKASPIIKKAVCHAIIGFLKEGRLVK